MNDNIKILQAARFAALKHAGETRKGSSDPYICHPLMVAELVASVSDDVDVIVAAILHDTVEDTTATLEEIEKTFGARVAGFVAENTDDPSLSPNEQKAEQLRLIDSKSPDAQLIKVCDCLSNGADIITNPPPWRRKSIVGYLRNKNAQVRKAEVPQPLIDRWETIWAILTEHYPEAKAEI